MHTPAEVSASTATLTYRIEQNAKVQAGRLVVVLEIPHPSGLRAAEPELQLLHASHGGEPERDHLIHAKVAVGQRQSGTRMSSTRYVVERKSAIAMPSAALNLKSAVEESRKNWPRWPELVRPIRSHASMNAPGLES